MDPITDTILKTIENKDIPKIYSSIHSGEPHDSHRLILGDQPSSREFITSQHEIRVPTNLVVFTFTPLGCLAYSVEESEAYDREILFNGQKVEKRSGEQITIPWFLLGEFPLSKTAMVFYPGSIMPNTVHLFDNELSYFDLFSLNKNSTDDTLRDSRAPKAHALLQKLREFSGFNEKIIKDMNIKNWSDLKADTYDQHYKKNPRKASTSPHTSSFGTFTTKYLLDYLSKLIPAGQLGIVYINACNPLSRVTTNHNTILLDYTAHYVRSKERLEAEGRAKMEELQRLAKIYYKATTTKYGTRVETAPDSFTRVPMIGLEDPWFKDYEKQAAITTDKEVWEVAYIGSNGTPHLRAGMELDDRRDAAAARKAAYMSPEARVLRGFSRKPPPPKKGGSKKYRSKKSKRKKSRKNNKNKNKKTRRKR